MPKKRTPKLRVDDASTTPPHGDVHMLDDHERIRARAYELYLQRGDIPGNEVEDWLRAEREHRSANGATADVRTDGKSPSRARGNARRPDVTS